jgi:hypothetical protein
MPEIPRALTPITMATAAPLLVTALGNAGVPNLEQDMCALLLAQIALEVANGNACNNHNPGNITASDTGTRDYFRPAWFTVDATSSPQLQALNAQMQKGQAPRAFRSYPDFPSGFADHATTLFHTFPTIIAAARTGDALQVAGAIRSSGYTPGINLTAVAASLDSLRKQFLARGLFSDLPLDRAAETPRRS